MPKPPEKPALAEPKPFFQAPKPAKPPAAVKAGPRQAVKLVMKRQQVPGKGRAR